MRAPLGRLTGARALRPPDGCPEPRACPVARTRHSEPHGACSSREARIPLRPCTRARPDPLPAPLPARHRCRPGIAAGTSGTAAGPAPLHRGIAAGPAPLLARPASLPGFALRGHAAVPTRPNTRWPRHPYDWPRPPPVGGHGRGGPWRQGGVGGGSRVGPCRTSSAGGRTRARRTCPRARPARTPPPGRPDRRLASPAAHRLRAAGGVAKQAHHL